MHVKEQKRTEPAARKLRKPGERASVRDSRPRNRGKMKHLKDRRPRKKLRGSRKRRKEPSFSLREPRRNEHSGRPRIEKSGKRTSGKQ